MSRQEIRVRPATEADRPAWDAFVATRPEGDPLQTWAWGEANRVVGELPHRLVAERSEGRLGGLAQLLVRRAAFGRTLAYLPHGPLWQHEAPDGEEIFETLLTDIATTARSLRAIVAKLDPRATPEQGADELAARLERFGLRRARHDLQAPTTRILEIPASTDEADLTAGWDKDARNLVRRARREGVETDVATGQSPDRLSTFHELLQVTAGRAGFRHRPLTFLEQLAGEAGDGLLVTLATLQGRPIAGTVVPVVGDRAYYLYGASLREPALKHTHGAYAALAATLGALAERGVRAFDLWGVAEPGDRTTEHAWEGFSAFKRQFGGALLRHPGTFDLVVDPLWYRIRDVRERMRG